MNISQYYHYLTQIIDILICAGTIYISIILVGLFMYGLFKLTEMRK